jgi:hypothetical protein
MAKPASNALCTAGIHTVTEAELRHSIPGFGIESLKETKAAFGQGHFGGRVV